MLSSNNNPYLVETLVPITEMYNMFDAEQKRIRVEIAEAKYLKKLADKSLEARNQMELEHIFRVDADKKAAELAEFYDHVRAHNEHVLGLHVINIYNQEMAKVVVQPESKPRKFSKFSKFRKFRMFRTSVHIDTSV
jgi:hypothetical protein